MFDASYEAVCSSSTGRWVTCISPSVSFGFAKVPLKICTTIVASVRSAQVRLGELLGYILQACVRGAVPV